MRITVLFFLSLLYIASAEPLTIWISSQQDKTYYENMAKLYKTKVDPKFEAKVEAFGFKEMPDKLAITLKSGVGSPDIVQLDEVLFGIYLHGPVPFVDLTEKIKKANLDKTIHPKRMDLFKWKNKSYAVPQSLSAYVMYYRKDLFEELNLTTEDFATWEKVAAVGKKLAAQGQSLMPVDPSFLEVFLRQQGTDLIGPDGKGFPDFDKAVKTMTWMKKMVDEGIFMQPSRGSVFDPVFFNGPVANDEIICIPGADWFGLDMLQQFLPHQEGKWGIMPLPTFKGSKLRTATFAGQGLLIPQASKKQDKSWDFIKFVMTDKKANIDRFVDGNSFPAYMPAWDEKEILEGSDFFGGQSMGKLMKELAPEIPKVNVGPKRPQAVFMLQENYFSAILYGTYTAEEGLKEMIENLK
jgi:ABC-type glycerol-3-phosphate transport system substrate-binding protein